MRKHSQSNNVMRFLQFLCMRYLPIISWLILTWSLGLAMGLDSNVRNFLQYHTTTFSSMVNFFKPFKGCTYMILSFLHQQDPALNDDPLFCVDG